MKSQVFSRTIVTGDIDPGSCNYQQYMDDLDFSDN